LKLFAAYSLEQGNVVHTITARLDNATDKLYRNHLSLIKDLAPEMGANFTLLYNVKFYGNSYGLPLRKLRGGGSVRQWRHCASIDHSGPSTASPLGTARHCDASNACGCATTGRSRCGFSSLR
jgi:hypothetical protein